MAISSRTCKIKRIENDLIDQKKYKHRHLALFENDRLKYCNFKCLKHGNDDEYR